MQFNEQFLYLHLKFTPKIRADTVPIPLPREVVIEVPRDLLQSDHSPIGHAEKTIAMEIARGVALNTFPVVAERVVGLYDEALPAWRENRFHVMNERPCDHEQNGTRAWRIA
jgi:hypothetical protein